MIYDFVLLLRNPHLRSRILLHWLVWILATGLGWAAAGLTGLPIGRVVVVEGGSRAILTVAGNMGLIGALIGGLVGAGQWLFFRRRHRGAALWLFATAAGWGLGLPLALIVNFLFGLGISAGLYGLFVGAGVALLQWSFCRPIVPDLLRWLVANLLAYALGISGAGWLERSLLIATGGAWGAAGWQTALTAALAGVIVGLITGVSLQGMLVRNDFGRGHA